MVEDTEYPERLFSEAKCRRRESEIAHLELKNLADSVRLLESTVNELRNDLRTLKDVVIDKV